MNWVSSRSLGDHNGDHDGDLKTQALPTQLRQHDGDNTCSLITRETSKHSLWFLSLANPRTILLVAYYSSFLSSMAWSVVCALLDWSFLWNFDLPINNTSFDDCLSSATLLICSGSATRFSPIYSGPATRRLAGALQNGLDDSLRLCNIVLICSGSVAIRPLTIVHHSHSSALLCLSTTDSLIHLIIVFRAATFVVISLLLCSVCLIIAATFCFVKDDLHLSAKVHGLSSTSVWDHMLV